MPAATAGFNTASLKGNSVGKQLQKAAEQLRDMFPQALVNYCLSGEVPVFDGMTDTEELDYLRSCVKNINPETFPPICTHNMLDDLNDPILRDIRRCKLFSSPWDPVKVIFYPQFLSTNSPLLPMEYDEFVHGCHLGVFPSSYEPWGYTSAECAVIGIPSVTTNMSGFGCFVTKLLPDPREHGIFIIDRKKRNVEESIHQLTSCLLDFTEQYTAVAE